MDFLPLFRRCGPGPPTSLWEPFVAAAMKYVWDHCAPVAQRYPIEDPENAAGDATAETLRKVWLYAGRRYFQNEGRFRSWLKTIAENTTIDVCDAVVAKDRREGHAIGGWQAAQGAPPARPPGHITRHVLIRIMIEVLPPLHFRVIVLRSLSDDEYETPFVDIARALSLDSAGCARRIYHQALDILRYMLGDSTYE